MIEKSLVPFRPLTTYEREILEKIIVEYNKIYSDEFSGQPAVRNGGLPAVARWIAERLA